MVQRAQKGQDQHSSVMSHLHVLLEGLPESRSPQIMVGGTVLLLSISTSQIFCV